MAKFSQITLVCSLNFWKFPRRIRTSSRYFIALQHSRWFPNNSTSNFRSHSSREDFSRERFLLITPKGDVLFQGPKVGSPSKTVIAEWELRRNPMTSKNCLKKSCLFIALSGLMSSMAYAQSQTDKIMFLDGVIGRRSMTDTASSL